jgi:DNA repair protein SbcC/Rad50
VIIKKALLNPFGASGNREYSFTEGLNVLLGPNEAGKSTLVNAIYAALFVPPDVRRNHEDWSRLLQRYLPYPQGDTVRVSLDLALNNTQKVNYSCAWGSAKGARLVFEDGTEINDPAAVKLHLEQMLRFGKGTYREVLFARQEEMNQTFLHLRENQEANQSVSGLLRTAVFESGGVSLELLETRITAEYNRLLDNWDLDQDGPRGGKGINNPHKNKVGEVLSAYYKAEEVKQKIKNMRADEGEIARLAGQIEELDREEVTLTATLSESDQLEEDIRKRGQLEPELATLRTKDQEILAVISQWPVIQSQAAELTLNIEKLQTIAGRLEAEREQVKLALKEREKRSLLERVKPLKAELDNKKARLASSPAITKEDLKYLEAQERREAELKAVVGAMKLKAVVRATDALKLRVTAGFDDPLNVEVKKEELLKGEGRLLLEGPGWSVDIQAGEEDLASLIAEAASCRESLQTKLAELELTDLEAARDLLAQRSKYELELKTATTRLKDNLGEFDFAELEAEVSEMGPESPRRDLELIEAEINSAKIDIVKNEGKLEQLQAKLKAWEAQYDSLSGATEQMAAVKQKLQDVEEKLAGLAPLPEQYSCTDEFFAALKKMRSRSSEIKEQRMEVRETLLQLQQRMPEESTEELEEELALLEAKYLKLKRDGRAINLVKSEFEELKKELDQDTYAPLQKRFARYLALATGNRYNLAALDGVSPEGIITAEGKTLPVELLSAGTTSGAALALRLALAAYLLQDAGGFMIMDDPLVHLDPDRRKAAAALIAEFAAEKQTIIATCDPQTAALLGGNTITV